MNDEDIGKFYENAARPIREAFANAEKAVDRANDEFRRKGMSGTPEEREQFLKQCYHTARFNMRTLMQVVPGLGGKSAYDEAVRKILEATARHARETGFDDDQTRLYLDAHRKAYESLAEESGLR